VIVVVFDQRELDSISLPKGGHRLDSLPPALECRFPLTQIPLISSHTPDSTQELGRASAQPPLPNAGFKPHAEFHSTKSRDLPAAIMLGLK
jgi:hypothetical protein